MAFLGTTDKGEEVEISKRAAESDLLVYVNINLVAMDGGWKSHGDGPGVVPEPAPPPQRAHDAAQPERSWTSTSPSCTRRNWRMGEVIREAGVKIFQIETTLNTDTFPKPFDFLMKREWEWTARDRATFVASSASRSTAPRRKLARKIFHSIRAPHAMTERAGRRGRRRARGHDRQRLQAAPRRGRGPDRHPHDGAALHLPVQRELGDEPDPRDVPRARLLLQPVPRAGRSCARAACSS